jgi:phosphoribosyl-ATP pyrophosphohydrolase
LRIIGVEDAEDRVIIYLQHSTVKSVSAKLGTVLFHSINGRVFDRVNLVEEIGDVMWYLALLADELGVSFEEIWEKNINKLRQRYPEKYSVEQSEHRDLASERKILET